MNNSLSPFDPARIAADFETQRPLPEEVQSLAQTISIQDALTATGYGAKEQRDLGELSDVLLKRSSGKALQDAVDAIHALQQHIEALDLSALHAQKGFFRSFFTPKRRQLAALQQDYTEATYLVERLASQLDMASLALQKEMSLLDSLYIKTQTCYHALKTKILAGEQALSELKQAKPAQGQDFEALTDLFLGRLHQLRQSKTICLQMALQIRLTQHNQHLVVQKLKQTTELALPLWQNQLALALNIHQQQLALDAYRSSAQQSARALKQTGRQLRTGGGDVLHKGREALSELERFQEADQHLKRVMDEALTHAQQANIPIRGTKN